MKECLVSFLAESQLGDIDLRSIKTTVDLERMVGTPEFTASSEIGDETILYMVQYGKFLFYFVNGIFFSLEIPFRSEVTMRALCG